MNRGMRLKLGLLVLLAVGLLTGLLVMFGSFPNVFTRTTSYTVVFTDAPGLTPGAPVRRSGVKVGSVRDVVLDEDAGVVRVKIALDRPYTIRKADQASLVASLFGNDAVIDLVPRDPDDKDPDRTPLEPHTEFIGVRSATVNTVLKGAADVVPTTQKTLDEMRKSMQRIEKFVERAEKTIPQAEETLKVYRELGEDARKAIPDVLKTNAQFQRLVRQAEELVPEIQRTNEQVNGLARDVRSAIPEVLKTNKEIAETAKSYRELAPTIEGAVGEYQALAGDVRRAIPEVLKTNREIAEVARTVRDMAPTVETTLEEYRGLASDVRKTIPQVRDRMEDVGAAARRIGQLAERAEVILEANQAKINKAVDNLNKTLEGAAELLSDDNVKKASRTLDNVNRTAESVARLLNDENIENAGRTLANITRASEKLPSISKNADDLTRESVIIVKKLGDTLLRVDVVLTDAQKLLADGQKTLTEAQRTLRPLTERGERMVKNADEALQKTNMMLTDVQSRSAGLFRGFDDTTAKVNLILDDVRGLLRAIDRADGTFRRFLTDPSMYNNVDAVTATVLKLLPRIDRVLKDFETFADKLARHPELIGVGGAVRPSDGLKTAPTAPLPPPSHPTFSPKR